MAGCMPGGPFYTDEARPFAQRNKCMTLDIVRPDDIPKGKIMYPKDEDKSLKTNDISRCQPHYEHLNYLNKPDLSVGCTEPEHAGSKARTYYAPMDRRPRDLSLTTADIEYAQPKAVKKRGNRHTDPVCPNYEFATSYKREPTPPRFNGRHTHDISDIEMSCSRIRHPERNYVRDPNESRDIEYASANYHERMKRTEERPRHDRSMNVKDISEPKRMRPRETNPLDPVYTVPTHATTSLHAMFSEEPALGASLARREADQHGAIHGSKPRKLQWDNGEPQMSLLREDIAGTVPQRWIGSVPHNIYDPPEVRPMISFHDPHDIPGAQVGSLKKGIEGATRRQLNPMNPSYTMLDGDMRPHAVPVMEAERGPARYVHPMMQNRAAAASLPNLQSGTPAGSRGGSALQSGRSGMSGMNRDMSQGNIPGASRPGRLQMGGGTPPGAAPPGYQYQTGDASAHVGNTLKFAEGSDGPPSRRSMSSAGGNYRDNQCYQQGY